LERGDGLDCMGAAHRLDARLGHAEMLDLAFGDQVADGAGDIFYRHIGIDAMLVQQIDDLNTQSLQRSLGGLADGVRMAAKAVFALVFGSIAKPNLVAIVTWSRTLRKASPTISSLVKGTIDFGGI